MTVVISPFVVAFCPNLPSQAQSWFLDSHERERLLLQLEASRGAEGRGSAAEEVSLWAVLVDWRIHLFTMCFFCCDITAASVASFSPTILTGLGWTNTVAQLMTMPVWASAILATFSMTWITTYTDRRAPFVLGCISCQLTGWIIMRVFVPQAGVRYMALFVRRTFHIARGLQECPGKTTKREQVIVFWLLTWSPAVHVDRHVSSISDFL